MNLKHTLDANNVLLYGAIMLANIDYIGILDYAIKAVVGGAIWLGFKIAGDYYTNKRTNTGKANTEK